jgi:hypothetical protein
MINLRYQIPFTESASVEGDFMIQGTAINETTTSNNHKFIAEELSKSANSLTGVPLLVDHENKVENIKGRVLKGSWNEIDRKVDFKAKVMDELCKQMIKDGRLNSVSVGATVSDVEELDGVLIPRGIQFKELSLVAVPADQGATFNIALKEAYETQSKAPVISVATEKIVKEEAEEEDDEDEEEEVEVEEVQVQDKAKETMPILENKNSMKGGLKMSEEIKTEAVDTSKVLMEKLEAMEKANKAMAEKLEALSAPKAKEILRNEFEESEADVNESYKVITDSEGCSLIRNLY